MKSLDQVAQNIKSNLMKEKHEKIQADYIDSPGFFQITYRNQGNLSASEGLIRGDIEGNEMFWIEQQGFYYKGIHTADDPRLMMETYMPFENKLDSYSPEMIRNLMDKFHGNYSEEILQAIKNKEIKVRPICLESSQFTAVETAEALQYVLDAFVAKENKKWRKDLN
ncbi:MAG: hypothetical protein ABEI74_00325 [Candidatus Pacearchaeota archaeon]